MSYKQETEEGKRFPGWGRADQGVVMVNVLDRHVFDERRPLRTHVGCDNASRVMSTGTWCCDWSGIW